MTLASSDIIGVIIFLGLAQGAFLSMLFLSKKGLTHKILGVFLLLLALLVLDMYAGYTLLSLDYPHLIDISQPLGFILGPILYAHYYNSIHQKLPKKLWWHSVPFLIFLLNQVFYFIQNADFKYNSFIRARELILPLREAEAFFYVDPLGVREYTGLPVVISLAFYFFLILKLLQSDSKGTPTSATLTWLKRTAVVYAIYLAYAVLELLILNSPNFEYITALYLTGIIYFMGFEAIRNSHLVSHKLKDKKYEHSSLPPELKATIKARLIRHMREDKPFLDNLFSINLLASNITASPNHVSQVLNQDFGKNYHEFVADYRIEAATAFLTDPTYQDKNIEEISVMVGYNSKAAFNKAFKRITGKTPFQYKKDSVLGPSSP